MNITAGKYKGRKILAPDEKITRPTLSKIRMAVFNTLQSLIDFEGSSFLDMFAGSGIMGLEAISRGFEKVVAIEQNPKVLTVLNENYKTLNVKPNILRGDSLKIIPNDFFDVIYIDPPYYAGIYEKILSVLPKCNIIVIEHVTNIDFDNFKILKQKKYGDKFLTYLKPLNK